MEKLVSIDFAIKNISESTPPNRMQTRIIAIDGCGGAGKSTLAMNLAKHLNHCSIIHTDDFASWDNPLNWYPRIVEQVFAPLHLNQEARFQKFDWKENRLSGWVVVDPQDFIIIEGVSSSRKEFRPFLSFSIFVKTSREIRLERGIKRDGEAAKNKWLQWMAEEDLYIQQNEPEKFANLVVNGEVGDENRLAVLS